MIGAEVKMYRSGNHLRIYLSDANGEENGVGISLGVDSINWWSAPRRRLNGFSVENEMEIDGEQVLDVFRRVVLDMSEDM